MVIHLSVVYLTRGGKTCDVFLPLYLSLYSPLLRGVPLPSTEDAISFVEPPGSVDVPPGTVKVPVLVLVLYVQ
jgi:hypothetical protein